MRVKLAVLPEQIGLLLEAMLADGRALTVTVEVALNDCEQLPRLTESKLSVVFEAALVFVTVAVPEVRVAVLVEVPPSSE